MVDRRSKSQVMVLGGSSTPRAKTEPEDKNEENRKKVADFLKWANGSGGSAPTGTASETASRQAEENNTREEQRRKVTDFLKWANGKTAGADAPERQTEYSSWNYAAERAAKYGASREDYDSRNRARNTVRRVTATPEAQEYDRLKSEQSALAKRAESHVVSNEEANRARDIAGRINAYETSRDYERRQAAEKLLEDAKAKQATGKRASEYAALMREPDFAELSQYRSTQHGEPKYNALAGMYTDTGFEDVKYDYINGNEAARDVAGANEQLLGISEAGIGSDRLQRMTPDEISIYNYLYNKQGEEAADEFIEFIATDPNYTGGSLNAREREYEEQRMAEYAKEDPVGTSVASVMLSPYRGIAPAAGAIGDFLEDGRLERDAGYYSSINRTTAARSAVNEYITENYGSGWAYAYDQLMSIGDNAMRGVLFGEGSGLALMAADAGASKVQSALDRGLGDGQALALGIIAGAAEVFTEKFSLDQLLKKAKPGKSAFLRWLAQVGVEGSEEGASNIINTFFDVLIAGDESEWRTAVRKYEEQGMSESKAFGQAMADKLGDIGMDVLGGMISGGIMGAPGAIYQGTINRRTRAAERAAEVQQTGADAAPVQQETGNAAEMQQNENAEAVPELVPVSEKAASRLATGKNNIIAKTKDDIVAFVRNALRKKGGSERLYMGTIPDSAAQTVMESTGVNVAGYNAILPGDSVQHIFNHHGNEQTEASRGQRAVTPDDFALISQVLAAPDSVTLSSENDSLGRRVLIFEKQIGDNIVTAQAVTDGRHALTTDSMWVQKKKEPTDTTHHAGNDSALDAYVRNVPPSGSFDDSISQSAQNVNTEQARPTAQTLSDEITRQWDSAEERSATSQERSSTSSEPMPLTVGEEFSRRNRAALARSEVERTGILAGARDEDISAAERISRAVGRKVLFYSSNSTQNKAAARANGYYKGGVIYVNAESGNPVAQIISHELTHSLEGSKLYSQLSDMVLSRMSESGVNVEDARKQKAALYERSGAVLEDNAAVDRELVAEYIEKHLLHDEDAVIRMVRENRGLAVRIRNWLDSLLAKLGSDAARERAFVRRAINLYARALDDAENVTGRARRRTVDARARAEAAMSARAEETAAETSRERLRQAGERLAAGEMSDEEYDREAEQAEPLARERELREAREYGQNRTEYSFGDEENPYAGRSMTEDSEIYSYDFLTSLPDMQTVTLPDVDAVRDANGMVDKRAVVDMGIKNARSVGTERDGSVFVRNSYTGTQLRVDSSSIRHGLNGVQNRLLTNARLGAVIGDVVKNAVPINALHNKAAGVTGTYAMAGYATDSNGREFVAVVTVEQRSGDISGVEVYDVTHAVSGRQKRSERVGTKPSGSLPLPPNASTISIADLLEIVKGTHQSVLSEDVLAELGETRNPEGYYNDKARYSISEDSEGRELSDEMPEWIHLPSPDEDTASDPDIRYSISETFADELEEWNNEGRPSGARFVLGSTGEVLQGLGAIESDIYMNGDKISEILEKHPEMTLTEIENIPQILDDPVLVLKSRGVNLRRQNSRLVLFGSVTAQNGRPIMSVLDLRPTENGFLLDDMQKVNSAYTKGNDPIGFVSRSEILYADEKRTVPLLRSLGLQLRPKDLLRNGSIGSISYSGTNVNIQGVPFSEIIGADEQNDNAEYSFEDDMPEGLRLPSPEDEDMPANTEFIDLPTQEDVDAPRGPRYEAERIPMPEDRDAPDASYRRKKLSTRARSYFTRAMKEASDTVAARLGVPEGQVADTVGVTLDALADMYMTDGTLDENTVTDAFETVYNSVTIIDSEFYEMYKPVRQYLRETTVYVSDAVKNEFADWGSFRRSVGSRIKIRTGEGAASAMAVDEVYSELSQTWPELFPDDISVPSSQLERMDEVYRSIERVEKTLDEAAGESSGEVKQAARHDFNEAVYDLVSRLRDVRNFERSREVSRTAKDAKEAENRDRLLRNAEARGLSEEEAARLYKTSRAQFAAFSKAKALNLLTESDRLKLGQLLRGEIQTDALDAETDNVRGITAVYEAARAYEDTMTALRGYEQSRAAALRDEAAAMLEGAEKWHDKSKGYLYARETAERNVRDVVGDEKKAKEIIDTYFTPVHKNEAESTKMKNRLRDTVRALALSRRVKKGNSMSEAALVQFVGEAEDNIAVLSTGVNAHDPQAKRGGMTLEEWRGALENAWKENQNIDRAKIENAVETFRELYDELFRMINEARVRNGYEPISYRRGYFPHFQSEKRSGVLGWLGKAFGVQTEVTNLPTTINGRTEDFKPGIRWMGAALERKGNATDFDAVEGFDRYLEVAADVIWHTDDIQRLRALATATRERTTDESIQADIERIRADDNLTEEEKQDQIRTKVDKGRYELSNFAGWLDEYTNLLAGKKSRADRQMEADAGRGMYNVLKALESRVGANMVGFNVRSATTNFIPITQGWADLGGGTVLRGMWDTLKAHSPRAKFMQAVRNGGASIGDIIEALSDNAPLDNFSDMSEFLTNRRGSERLVQTRTQEIVGKTPFRMARDLMETIDRFSSETLVRARYAQNVKRGLSEQSAMDEADAWAAGVMAARSKGSMPTLFSRANPLTKLLTQFQLEVNNQFSYLMKDIPREHRDKGLASLAWALLKFAIGAWLFNELSELLTGYRPALDPIGILNDTVGDLTGYELPNVWSTIGGVFTGHLPSLEKTKQEGVYGAGKNLAKNVAEELPFVGGLIGGGRIPISSAVPNPVNLWSAATNTDWAPEKRWQTARKELTKPLTYLLPRAGGGAVQRAIEGAATSAAGGSYTVNTKGEDILQYPMYTDEGSFWKTVQAMIMGKSSLGTAQDWVRSGFDSLSAKQTTAYREMTDAGMGQRDAFELLREIEGDEMTKAEKMRAVVDATDNEAARLAAMKTVLSEAAYDKVAAAGEFGVSSESWTELMETLPDYDDGNGSYSQAEVTDALDDMSWLTREEKAVLWQAQAKNWTAKKNPYDKELGEEVADRLNREEEEEEMPEWVSLPTP